MKEKLSGILLEERGKYSGNGLKTTRLREIGHPLISVCERVYVCVADFLFLLYFLLHFVQSKICCSKRLLELL